ncbi:MAG: pyridoxal-phosphate dependent enzyme [Balneolales bacterium]
MPHKVGFADICNAHQRIAPHVHRTPVLTCSSLDKRLGAGVFFKCENFQKTGSFKIRGASNALLSLTKEEKNRGVITHSSGNHAQALAHAARSEGIKATIIMPSNSTPVKMQAVAGYGADIRSCDPGQESREAVCREVQQETGSVFISPYNDNRIIAGQGTAALELASDMPDLDMLLVPVGGGGLLAGSALAAKGVNTDIKVIGTEPETANDAYQSFRKGKIIPVTRPDTVADGLRTSLGILTFAVISEQADDIITVSEEAIILAMRYVWERMKIIIEPSSAVPVAALMSGNINVRNKQIGVVLSGGNVNLDQLPWMQHV